MRREAAAPGGEHNDQQGGRRAKAAGRQQPAKGVARHEEQHQHHAKSRAGADAQHFRAGHRVAGQALDNTAGDRQHDPGEQRRQHPRPAPGQQLLQQIAVGPQPAVGIATKGQRHAHRQQQQRDACENKPLHMIALRLHIIAAVHHRGADAAQPRQQPQQQRRANQGGDRAGGDFPPYPAQPEDHLIGKPQEQRADQRRQQQPRQQPTGAKHFRQQRREQADKADNPYRVHQQRADDDRQRQGAEARQGQRQPEVTRHPVIEPHQGQRPQQQQGEYCPAKQLRPQALRHAPVGLRQRPGAPQEHALQLVVMENHHQLVKRATVKADHQPRQDQRYRRQALAPRDAKHQRAHQTGPGQRGELRRQHAGNSP